MRKIPPAYISIIFIVLILGFSLGNAPVFGDADTAWHMAAGDLIRSQHGIPLTDPWSFTTPYDQWYNLSWLFDITTSKIFALGGFNALYVLIILTYASVFVFMAQYCIERGASLLAVFFVSFFCVLVLSGGVSMRPAVCSVVFAVAFYDHLNRYRETGQLKKLWILPVLMGLWVNLHGGFLIAYIIIAPFVLEALWGHDRKKLSDYSLITTLCLCASLINPYNFAVYYGALRTLNSSIAPAITEWQPVAIGHNSPVTFLLLLFMLTFNAWDKRLALPDRILSVVILTMSLISVRYSLFASLLLMPTLSLRLTAIMDDSARREHWQKKNELVMNDMHKTDIRNGMAVIAVALIAFLCIPSTVHDKLITSSKGFPVKKNPIAEAAFIEKNYPKLRFMTDYNLGGYLDYIWRGKVKVFVDGRANSLYSDDLLQDYSEFVEDRGFGGRAMTVANQYKLDGVIISNEEKNAALWEWNPYWKAVYHGKVASIYVKKELAKKPAVRED
jgi:hypothetical protein